jgi:hypothetical protein
MRILDLSIAPLSGLSTSCVPVGTAYLKRQSRVEQLPWIATTSIGSSLGVLKVHLIPANTKVGIGACRNLGTSPVTSLGQ